MGTCAICEDMIDELFDETSRSWNPFVWLKWKLAMRKHQKEDHYQ